MHANNKIRQKAHNTAHSVMSADLCFSNGWRICLKDGQLNFDRVNQDTGEYTTFGTLTDPDYEDNRKDVMAQRLQRAWRCFAARRATAQQRLEPDILFQSDFSSIRARILGVSNTMKKMEH